MDLFNKSRGGIKRGGKEIEGIPFAKAFYLYICYKNLRYYKIPVSLHFSFSAVSFL